MGSVMTRTIITGADLSFLMVFFLQAEAGIRDQCVTGVQTCALPICGDEIAHVAAAFNRMAAELAVRDEALRTSDRLRRQMLADVSHELKTPLTAMRGYVETLHKIGRASCRERV